MGWDGLDWIHMAQDGNQWRALVNTAMGLGAPYNVGDKDFAPYSHTTHHISRTIPADASFRR